MEKKRQKNKHTKDRKTEKRAQTFFLQNH